MKPPLTVEAKVAEELRTWLSSELELLNASNTNQFAHHVVTIFLHEGLDIEDEPLSKGERGWDIFKDISSIKKGKTIDNQKKAAVQFLRSAVCGDSLPVESDIKEIIEELMVKIGETKHKMKAKKTQRKGLLAPARNNAGNEGKTKLTRNRKEKYTEAFPSLSGGKSPKKNNVTTVSPRSVWDSAAYGKENLKEKAKKSVLKLKKIRPLHSFSSEDESQACSVAMKVAASCLPIPLRTSPEVAEVPQASKPSFLNLEQFHCWTSAFIPTVFTKTFTPSLAPLKFKEHEKIALEPKKKPIRPFINRQIDYHFASIMDWDTRHDFKLNYSEEDKEVCEIFHQFKKRDNQFKAKPKKPLKEQEGFSFQAIIPVKTRTFPDHYGTFWDDMIDHGQMSLYPDFECLVDDLLESDEEGENKRANKKGWGSSTSTKMMQGMDMTIPSFYPKGDLGEDEPLTSAYPPNIKPFNSSPIYRFELQGLSRTNIVYPQTFYDNDVFQDESTSNWFSGCKGILHREDSDDEEEFDFEGFEDRHPYMKGATNDAPPYESRQTRLNNSIKKKEAAMALQLAFQQRLWATSAWDYIREELVTDMELCQTSGIDLGQPSKLTTSLSSEVDEMLQNAFINSLFSNEEPAPTKSKDLESAFNCEDVEKYLFDVEGGANNDVPEQQPFVVGTTCSSWLEKKCPLGGSCPYMHPSVPT